MRILLAHNSLYYPSFGGGDKSNRLLMEALAARGHEVRVVTRVEVFGEDAHKKLHAELELRGVHVERSEGPGLRYHLGRVDVRTLTRNAHLRGFFAAHVHAFDPDVILTSTDDPGQLLLDIALHAHRARVVYLVRATVAAPFGPDSASPSSVKTRVLASVDGAVGVSEYVARYTREHAGINAIYAPISLLPPGDCPLLAGFESRYASFVNPCAMKGLSIFLALAENFPQKQFAAVPTWGTTPADLEAMRQRPNISVLPPFDDFDDLLRQSSVMLVPSIWAEARSRVILEAMSRGIPVLASDVGGLSEAKLGVPYLLPVNPITSYHPSPDELMVPAADIPPQDIGPWSAAFGRLLRDRAHYDELSAQSRAAALHYIANLNVLPFETYLEQVLNSPRRRLADHAHPARIRSRADTLSTEKRRLLALRMQSARPKPQL